MSTIRDYISLLQVTMDAIPLEPVQKVIDTLCLARINNRQVFIMGNGGSASTASHFVCDLAKSTRRGGWPNFRVISLTDNPAIFSAYANDEGYENVFAQQLASFIQPGDIVIGISASGNSQNVIKAIELASRVNAKTIGFTGFDGGYLGKIVDVNVHINSNIIQHVEDLHLMLAHLICKAVTDLLEPVSIISQSGGYLPQETDLIELNTDMSSGIPIVMADFHASTRNQLFQGLLQTIEKELDKKLPMYELLPRLLQLTLEGVQATSGSIVVLDNNEAIEGVLAYEGKVEVQTAKKFTEFVEHGLIGWVAQNRESALVQSTLDDPRWLQRAWDNRISRSAISVPITDQDRVVGVMTLVNSQSRQFTLEDLAILTAIASTISAHKSVGLSRRIVADAN